ncbi:AbiH family protein [Staphylococcus equorum]
MTRLFVIGNGFDIAHGLNTNFEDFKFYILSNIERHDDKSGKFNSEMLKDLYLFLTYAEASYNIDYYTYTEDISKEWNQFETMLAYTPTFNVNNKFMQKDILDNRILSEREIENLYKIFVTWINSVSTKTKNKSKIFREEDLLLNFNYTNVVERNYPIIRENNMEKIHVNYIDGKEQLVYGHNEKFSEDVDKSKEAIRVTSFAENLKKSIEQQIKIKREFFEKIRTANITEIYFWGFSLSQVDKGYINQIVEISKSSLKSIKLCKHQYDTKKDFDNYKFFVDNINYKENLSIGLSCFDPYDRDQTLKN